MKSIFVSLKKLCCQPFGNILFEPVSPFRISTLFRRSPGSDRNFLSFLLYIGLRGVFKVFQCAQSISHIKIPILSHFGVKNFEKFSPKNGQMAVFGTPCIGKTRYNVIFLQNKAKMAKNFCPKIQG
jgi:hypothetical protein